MDLKENIKLLQRRMMKFGLSTKKPKKRLMAIHKDIHKEKLKQEREGSSTVES